MSKYIAIIFKWFLIIAIATPFIFVGLFIWFQYLFTIKGTSTCFMHHFQIDENSFIQSQSEIGRTLKEDGFHVDFKSNSYQKWTNGVTNVVLNADLLEKKETEKHRDLTICTSDKSSKDWQRVAVLLESKLAKNINNIYIQVQLDPEVLGISKDNHYSGFTGVVHVEYPITLEKFKNVEETCRKKLLIHRASNRVLNCD